MSRPKSPIPLEVQRLIERRLPLDEIVRQAKAAGFDTSRATVQRRLAEAKGKPRAKTPPRGVPPPAPAVPADMPETPEDIPAEASLAQLDEWIRGGEEMLAAAKVDGNISGWASAQRVVNQLSSMREKRLPPPPVDHDANPDLKRAGLAAAERLHAMIDRAFGPAGPLRAGGGG